MNNKPINFTFFGSSIFSIYVLDELKKLGYIPALVVTTPDKPQGRKLLLTPNVVKTWATQHNIPVYDPTIFDSSAMAFLKEKKSEVFIVASYGKILPKELIDIPANKTLNIHPSLLPQYRGASPLQAAILNDTKNTGVTIMRIDEEMDHGPIIAQKNITISEWSTYEIFEEMMAREGAQLLASILPDWVAGKIPEQIQQHASATYTKKSKKEHGLITFSDDPYVNFRKIQAYHQWPQTYFVVQKNNEGIRVKITDASYENNILTINTVIPEGGKEIKYTDFVNSYGDPSKTN